MTEQLQSMLREAADDRPDLALRGDPWRRGRRIRLRRRLAGVAGAAVTVSAVVAGAVLLATPGPTSVPEPAREEPVEPALPDKLYEVPLNIADISDEPLGEPAAVVYFARVRTSPFDEAARPVVIGAGSGEVRAVRQAGEVARAVPSPDGTKLALTHMGASGDEGSQSVVVVVDVATGESTHYGLPDKGLGAAVQRLVWTPDSTRLAITAAVTTHRDEDGNEATWVPGWLDLQSGQWHEHGPWEIFAYSPDGQEMFVMNFGAEYGVRDKGGFTQIIDARFDAAPSDAAFSPTGEHVAVLADGLEIFDSTTGERIGQTELGYYSGARIVGWGRHGLLVETTSVPEPDEWPTTTIERISVGDPLAADRSVILTHDERGYRAAQISIPATFLDAETLDAQPPDAGFDWLGLIPDPFLLALVAAIGIVAVMAYLGGRVSSGRGSATVPGSTGR